MLNLQLLHLPPCPMHMDDPMGCLLLIGSYFHVSYLFSYIFFKNFHFLNCQWFTCLPYSILKALRELAFLGVKHIHITKFAVD